MVTKAIVLAAGLGTRLRPLTCVTPKPLMPVWGEPMLARIVALLRRWGVTDIVVNCHYLHEQVEAWCAANGCRASYEPEILGTGGVLNPLREWIGKDEFYLVNGDIVVEGLDGVSHGCGGEGAPAPSEGPFDGIADKLRNKGVEVIGECLVTEEGPRTIETEPYDGLVTCWKSPDAGYDGTSTYCGIARLRPAILDYVKPTGFSTIIEAYEKAMMEGKFMRAVRVADMMWTDAGTIQSYIDLNETKDDNAFADLPQVKAALEALSRRDACSTKAAPVEQASRLLTFLGARGSERVFFRASAGRPEVGPYQDSIIVIYDDAKRGENAKYAGHAKWLARHGIAVPEILADLPEMKTLVMSNAGSTDLQHRLAEPGRKVLTTYAPVVEMLGRFGNLAEEAAAELPLEPPFDAALYTWERDLFAEFCLGRRYQRAMTDAVTKELEAVAARLEREEKALVHRDFQSTNVLFKNDQLAFIDFQGMRLGPAAYDLASLLYDPYVKITEADRTALATLYQQQTCRLGIVDVLPFAAVQRLVQALGAYGRLASVGQTQFGVYVLPALENLLAAADEAGLDAVGALAEELIAAEQHLREHRHRGCGDEGVPAPSHH